MLYRDICRTLAVYLWILLLPLCIPLFIAIYCEWIVGSSVYPQPPAGPAFLMTMLFTALLGGVFWLIGQKSTGHLYRREALLLVLLVYFLTPAIGALPFYLNETLENPIDAYFEATSGLTTTGASIIQAKQYDSETGKEIPIKKTFVTGEKTDYTYYGNIAPITDSKTQKTLTGVEALSPALLFWRALMQWLGGGGIVVMFVAILPALGVGGKVLVQTEITGPSKESMFPRIKETASQLWKVYLFLTLLEIFLLYFTNEEMSWFNASAISLSTISTGGFTPVNGGIASFNNPYTDWIIVIFMILGSISFAIYFVCMRGKFSRLKDPELRAFLLIILFSAIVSTWQLVGKAQEMLIGESTGTYNFWEAFRFGTFQVVSAQTSTGFTTANYDLWPFSVQVLMLILMYVGGMAGSTAGGLKVVRQQTFLKIMKGKIESIFRPDTVRATRLGNAIIDHKTATTVLCFFMVAAYLAIASLFVFVLFAKIDPETSFSTVSCFLNNVGIAFRMGGPTETFAFLPGWGKLLGCFLMIAGRLEFFALLIAFVPAFWKTTY
ncbi:MAG: Trk system potassium uptake protein TrkH [Chlamydiae bacterium]|nr:Trk system potassium uptake protein TrkH [Chlamydiota bacterium]